MDVFFLCSQLRHFMASPVASHFCTSALLCGNPDFYLRRHHIVHRHFDPDLDREGNLLHPCSQERRAFLGNVRNDFLKQRIGLTVLNRLTVLLTLCLCTLTATGQDSLTMDYLLDRIETQQLKRNDFFMDGIFPSYISGNRKFKTRKQDNTMFYNALIAYTLNDHYDAFPSEQKIICDSIISRSKRALSKFKNPNRPTYNFWRRDTTFRFPYNSLFFGPKKTLPDDLDDTVLGLMILKEDDSTNAVHALMQDYTNSKPPLKTTYKIYSRDSAYSTWFGKKMPVVFDVSVLCNVLSFVQRNNLQWTTADSASLQLIVKTIQRDDIRKHPLFVSPYYGNTSIILYHLARLMAVKDVPALEQLKPGLVTLARGRLQSSNNMLEKIILTITLLKWNEDPPSLNLTTSNVRDIETNDLPFFIGNIPSYFKQPWKEDFMSLRLLMYYHYCPAWNDCLLMEYLVLRQQKSKNFETNETFKH